MGHAANKYFHQHQTEKKEMKKKSILGIILTASLMLTIAVAAIFPAIANSTPSNSITKYGTNAEVNLQLPTPGGAITNRPTNLKISVLDYDKRSNSADALQVLIWVSAMNTYVPVAFISDQPWSAQDKANLNNSAMYLEVNGVVIRNNLKVVADKELDVWQESKGSYNGWRSNSWSKQGDETLIANLTVPTQLDFTGLPPVFGSGFTIPPMYLKFIGIAEGIPPAGQLSMNLPSGVAVTLEATTVPAWALVRIPAWGTGDQTFAASIYENLVITFTPP